MSGCCLSSVRMLCVTSHACCDTLLKPKHAGQVAMMGTFRPSFESPPPSPLSHMCITVLAPAISKLSKHPSWSECKCQAVAAHKVSQVPARQKTATSHNQSICPFLCSSSLVTENEGTTAQQQQQQQQQGTNKTAVSPVTNIFFFYSFASTRGWKLLRRRCFSPPRKTASQQVLTVYQ